MINLLPQKQKEEFFGERNVKILFNLGLLFSLFLILLGILLFAVKIHLTADIQEQKFMINSMDLAATNPQYKELEDKISESNKLISKINEFYEEQIDVTQILEKISDILPEGVTLASFSYQKDKSQVALQGNAISRESFLVFKKALESQAEIKNLSSPVSNLLKSSNIDFYFSFIWSK